MELAADPPRLAERLPLVTEGRDRSVPVAATRVAHGTDVNFGALTRARRRPRPDEHVDVVRMRARLLRGARRGEVN